MELPLVLDRYQVESDLTSVGKYSAKCALVFGTVFNVPTV